MWTNEIGRYIKKELILQGEFFFDLNFLENWDKELLEMNKRKRGAPYQYPHSLFEWLSPLYSFLASRKLEGSMNKLSRFIPRLKSCDHSTIIDRLNKLDLVLDFDRTKSYKTAVDSTGNKLTNRGEYITKKWKVHRDWVNVSIVIDRFTKELLDVEVALDREFSDSELAEKHLDNLQDVKIIDMVGDGAYYKKSFYDSLKNKNIFPVIKMRKDAKSGFSSMHSEVWKMRNIGGYEPWRDKYGYGHKWNIEGYNSSTKRYFGENCRMHNKTNCLKEAKHNFINNERMVKYAKKMMIT